MSVFTRRFRSLVGLLVGLLVGGLVAVAALLLVSPGSAAPSAPGFGWVPPDNTIVKVEGNRYDGFGIHYFDGSSIYPPTDSEALAECAEYDTRVAVVRCKTEVRVWYRDLGQLKRALRYAHSLG
jgi:hypothetical protein